MADTPYRIKVTGANPYTVRVRTAAQGPQGVQGVQGPQGVPGAGYTLPTATGSALGGVKVGNNLAIDGSGVLSASNSYVLPAATNTTLGGIIVGDNLTVTANGVLSGVNSYTLPAATNSTLGGIIVGNGLTVQANGSVSVSTNYIKDDAANGTLTITGDAGSTTADLLSETTGSHFQSTVNNSGSYGFVNWYLKASSGSQVITWGGYGIDTVIQAATISYNYAPSFGIGISYGRSLKISGSDITLEQTTAGGASLPTKLWTANSILIKSYADSRYLLTSNFTYANLTGTPTFATVATSGSYNDLSNLPALFDGSYTSLTNVPATFAPSAHNHTISQITDFPSLATVATSGLYSDLTGTPDLTGYLTTASAASTYATIASLSSYLTTASAASTYTTQTRTISAGTGLSGGGDLSANRTLSLAASGVTAGQYGSGSLSPTITVDAYGRVTSASQNAIYPDWNNISSRPIDSSTGTAVFSMAANLADYELIRAKLKDYSETRATPAISAGSLTLNLETANFFAVSLNASVSNAIVITNPPASGSVGSVTLELTADGTARTINWGTIKWPAGTPPTLTSASGKRDVFVFYTADGGTNWYGLVGGQNL